MSDPTQWQIMPEVVAAARARLSPDAWDFSAGGAETEVTLRRNRAALERIAFRTRVLRDVTDRHTGTTVLGIPLAMPVMLAPVGSVTVFHADGALACARAAERFGTGAVIGSLSEPGPVEVAQGSHAPLLLQVYLSGRVEVGELVRRAEDAGYRGICVTVDSAAYGRRERDLMNRFTASSSRVPPSAGATAVGGPPRRDDATWEDLAWLRSTTTLPLLVKGVGCAEDARRAVDHGVDVVYVSNHGGRQMDHLPATIEVLPEVVEAVAGRADVLVDSGFTRGSDVIKALALGARAVLVGKLMAWGLAAGGVPGLVRTLQILQTEMLTAMATLGVRDVTELSPTYLRPADPPPPPGALPWT